MYWIVFRNNKHILRKLIYRNNKSLDVEKIL